MALSAFSANRSGMGGIRMLSGLASFEPGQFLFDSAVFEP